MSLRKKMGKRITSWLLCMVMVLTLIPATVVYADEPGLRIPNASISEDDIMSWDYAVSDIPDYPAPKVDDYEILITDEGGGPTTYVHVNVHGLSCDLNKLCSSVGLPAGVYEIRLYAADVEGFESWPKFLGYTYTAKTYIDKINIIGISGPIAGDRVGDNLDNITAESSSYVITSKNWWCDSPGHVQQMPSSAVFEEGLEYSLSVIVKPANNSFYMNADTTLLFNSGAHSTDAYAYFKGSYIGNTVSIVAHRDTCSHLYKKTRITKATTTAEGNKETICEKCGTVLSTTPIYPAKTISLSTINYTYDGKVKKPAVTVKDSKGKAISTSDYTVTYPSGRKNVGSYTVKVAFKGNYSGTKSLTFKINPPKTALKTLKSGKKSFKAIWTKKSTQVTGYQIQYSTSSTFASGNKTATVKSYKIVSKTIKSLKAKKKYYVRIRTYKTVGSTNYYSAWSAKKYVKTK